MEISPNGSLLKIRRERNQQGKGVGTACISGEDCSIESHPRRSGVWEGLHQERAGTQVKTLGIKGGISSLEL